nr:DUF1572 family protein [Aneurinibacillus terranovensis]
MISRWTDFLTTDREKPDRNRDDEFMSGLITKKELLEFWETGGHTLFTALSVPKGKSLEYLEQKNWNKNETSISKGGGVGVLEHFVLGVDWIYYWSNRNHRGESSKRNFKKV